MSKLNYEYDGNLLESLQFPMPEVATSFHEIIFIIFQIIIQSSAILVDSYEKEVRTIHALSFSLSYQERYDWQKNRLFATNRKLFYYWRVYKVFHKEQKGISSNTDKQEGAMCEPI